MPTVVFGIFQNLRTERIFVCFQKDLVFGVMSLNLMFFVVSSKSAQLSKGTGVLVVCCY